jgi:putative transposase
MPRQARIVIPNVPHHVIQRGNMQRDIFFSDQDRNMYLTWLMDYSHMHKLKILAYCLMTNHLHLVVEPSDQSSISSTLKVVHTRHTQKINRLFGWQGHLLQGRYLSVPMDEIYCWVCVRYVEQNPLRAGMVKSAVDYPWSSAAHHCGLTVDPMISKGTQYSGPMDGWSEILSQIPDQVMVEKIRFRTQTGIPCGSDKFVHEIAKKTKRILIERPKGNPKWKKKSK